jgi:hypothetical protein
MATTATATAAANRCDSTSRYKLLSQFLTRSIHEVHSQSPHISDHLLKALDILKLAVCHIQTRVPVQGV